MADADKEKAEKVAAARKKYEQLKKQKEKGKKGDKKKKEDDKSAKKESTETPAVEDETETAAAAAAAAADEPTERPATEMEEPTTEESVKEDKEVEPVTPRPTHDRKQSISMQSKLRSESFRRGSNAGPTSPLPIGSPGEEVAEIYRKNAQRLEELERENRRLSKDLESAEARSRKLEDELEELREGNVQVAELRSRVEKAEGKAGETEKLQTELASLQRQNLHLQSLSSRPRGQSNASPSSGAHADLQAQLDSKVATIETMSLELSNLQSQLSRSTSGASDAHKEQITALEEKLKRAESAAGAAQRELTDLRTKVDRLSATAVREGSEKTSATTRIMSVERDLSEAQKRADEASKRAATLETKLNTLTKLQREGEPRRREAESQRESAIKEAAELKKRVVGLEEENRRLKIKERSRGEVDDDGIDELEDEERKRLESRVRELEGEVFELRRGVWRDKRMEMQDSIDDFLPAGRAATSPGGQFDEVDLSGGYNAPATHRAARPSQSKGRSGFANVFTSGFGALTGAGATHAQDDGLLEDDDFEEFDADAFRKAHEEEALKRIERVKEIKRGLREWVGWRLDLVEQRMGGGGAGEIFDI